MLELKAPESSNLTEVVIYGSYLHQLQTSGCSSPWLGGTHSDRTWLGGTHSGRSALTSTSMSQASPGTLLMPGLSLTLGKSGVPGCWSVVLGTQRDAQT